MWIRTAPSWSPLSGAPENAAAQLTRTLKSLTHVPNPTKEQRATIADLVTTLQKMQVDPHLTQEEKGVVQGFAMGNPEKDQDNEFGYRQNLYYDAVQSGEYAKAANLHRLIVQMDHVYSPLTPEFAAYLVKHGEREYVKTALNPTIRQQWAQREVQRLASADPGKPLPIAVLEAQRASAKINKGKPGAPHMPLDEEYAAANYASGLIGAQTARNAAAIDSETSFGKMLWNELGGREGFDVSAGEQIAKLASMRTGKDLRHNAGYLRGMQQGMQAIVEDGIKYGDLPLKENDNRSEFMANLEHGARGTLSGVISAGTFGLVDPVALGIGGDRNSRALANLAASILVGEGVGAATKVGLKAIPFLGKLMASRVTLPLFKQMILSGIEEGASGFVQNALTQAGEARKDATNKHGELDEELFAQRFNERMGRTIGPSTAFSVGMAMANPALERYISPHISDDMQVFGVAPIKGMIEAMGSQAIDSYGKYGNLDHYSEGLLSALAIGAGKGTMSAAREHSQTRSNGTHQADLDNATPPRITEENLHSSHQQNPLQADYEAVIAARDTHRPSAEPGSAPDTAQRTAEIAAHAFDGLLDRRGQLVVSMDQVRNVLAQLPRESLPVLRAWARTHAASGISRHLADAISDEMSVRTGRRPAIAPRMVYGVGDRVRLGHNKIGEIIHINRHTYTIRTADGIRRTVRGAIKGKVE